MTVRTCVCLSPWCEAQNLCSTSWRRGPESENDLHIVSTARTSLTRNKNYEKFLNARRARRYVEPEAGRLIREYWGAPEPGVYVGGSGHQEPVSQWQQRIFQSLISTDQNTEGLR